MIQYPTNGVCELSNSSSVYDIDNHNYNSIYVQYFHIPQVTAA